MFRIATATAPISQPQPVLSQSVPADVVWLLQISFVFLLESSRAVQGHHSVNKVSCIVPLKNMSHL